jgi:hypothetical protein
MNKLSNKVCSQSAPPSHHVHPQDKKQNTGRLLHSMTQLLICLHGNSIPKIGCLSKPLQFSTLLEKIDTTNGGKLLIEFLLFVLFDYVCLFLVLHFAFACVGDMWLFLLFVFFFFIYFFFVAYVLYVNYFNIFVVWEENIIKWTIWIIIIAIFRRI